MDLWIRSQDKKHLIKVNNIELSKTAIITREKDVVLLGIYNETRALEVLDEIQNIIKPTFITTGYDCKCEENPSDKLSFNLELTPTITEIKELSTYVYKMPEK